MPVHKSKYVSDAWKDGIFTDKVVFCTGGAGTICSAQVRALVHLGADACIVGRNVEKTEAMAKDIASARQGAKVIGLGAVDVRSPESVNAAVARCVQELGGIDFAIAGAAGNFLAPISQLSSNAFKSVIDIDVLGSYNTLKATIPYLMKSKGRIIFISATLHYTSIPLQAHVCAAKAAVDALSATTAIEFGPHGVTSNVIAPGAVAETEGMERLATKSSIKGVEKRVPLGRIGNVKDIADATVYLCSDAGAFMNGAVMVVDGGGWRTSSANPGSEFPYPEFLLKDDVVQGVKGMKAQAKAKL